MSNFTICYQLFDVLDGGLQVWMEHSLQQDELEPNEAVDVKERTSSTIFFLLPPSDVLFCRLLF